MVEDTTPAATFLRLLTVSGALHRVLACQLRICWDLNDPQCLRLVSHVAGRILQVELL